MPATEALVWAMLGTFGRDPTQNLGVIQPRNAPVTLEKIAIKANRNWPAWIDENDPETLVPVVRCADDIVVVVTGGDGRHSAWRAGWGVTRVVTEEITMPS